MLYVNTKLHAAFFEFFLSHRNGVLCDVVLEAGDVEVPVHKLVVASCSPYFMAMFNGKFCFFHWILYFSYHKVHLKSFNFLKN